MALSCSKNLSALLRGMTKKDSGNFFWFELSSFLQEKKLESHKKVCENKDFCNTVMLSKDTKIL